MNKIMVVDDTLDTIELMRIILSTHGFEPITFTSPNKAFEYLKNNDLPDLLILDMRMPEMNGTEFCDELRKNKKFDHLKIAFFTASNDLDHALLTKHHVLGFVFKPFDIKSLVKQINDYVAMGA